MAEYDDIIHLPRPVSEKRAQLPLSARAAQFSPFAALTGYDGVIAETARQTERFIDLDEGTVAHINDTLCHIYRQLSEQPQIRVTYFQPDAHKDGGRYLTLTGRVKWIDPVEGWLQLTDRTRIDFERLLELQLCPEEKV